jgi:hypothetical protein
MAFFRRYIDAQDDPVIGELSREVWIVLSSEFSSGTTLRALFQRLRDRRRFPRVDALKPPLDHLEDQGYIRMTKVMPSAGTGRPSVRIAIIGKEQG